jgi:hypothetical protein
MPAQPQWLTRIPEILAELESLHTPVVDRAIIERTFQVRRRRAAQLLSSFGGYQTGRAYLIERAQLIEQLRAIAQSGAFLFQVRRRERLAEALEATRRYRRAAAVVIPTPPAASAEAELLPAGVTLSPGVLQIEFAQPLELLEKLFQLAQTIAADFERFEGAALRRQSGCL